MAQSELDGNKIKDEDVYMKLWPNSKRETQQVNWANLKKGKTKRVDIEWIPILCDELNCTPNYLFNQN